MSTLVGPRGQVTIERRIRARLGVRTGWRAIQELVDGHVEIRFAPPEHRRSLAGSLSGYTRRSLPDQEALNAARQAAWTEAALEKFGARSSEKRRAAAAT